MLTDVEPWTFPERKEATPEKKRKFAIPQKNPNFPPIKYPRGGDRIMPKKNKIHTTEVFIVIERVSQERGKIIC